MFFEHQVSHDFLKVLHAGEHQHSLDINGSGSYYNLHTLAFFVLVFPGILCSLLIFSEPKVISAISAQDATHVLVFLALYS
jgi:hypothetical protein